MYTGWPSVKSAPAASPMKKFRTVIWFAEMPVYKNSFVKYIENFLPNAQE